MISKQGEGGSVHASGGILGRSNSNHYVDSAISLPTIVWCLVIDGVCLASTLLLFWLSARARRRTSNVKGNTAMVHFWCASRLDSYVCQVYILTFMLSTETLCRYLALGILLTVLGSCFIILPSGIAGISVPASVLSGVANLLILGIKTMPLTRCLFQHKINDARLPVLVNFIGLVLSAIVFVPCIVLSNMASIYRFTAGLNKNTRSWVASLNVDPSVAFYTTYFAAALVGLAIVAYALIRAVPNLCLRPKVSVFLHQTSQSLMETAAQILA